MGMKLYNKTDKRVLKEALMNEGFERTTLSFYKYYNLPNPQFFRDHLYILLNSVDVFGRIYIASEGVNGQISVPTHKMDEFQQRMDEIIFFQGMRLNIAIEDDGKSFVKLIIKLRNKIVADGLNDETFDVTKKGTHINAREFNELTQNPKAVIVDMRNHYESEVGHFEGAITPDVATFRDSLPIIEDMLEDKKDTPLIMYCTGGIRCEKASAYYKHKGFKDVYQLDGGIIEYARQVKEQGLENKFIGKNFVFDDRLGERISNDIIAKCHQCGAPCDEHTNCNNSACHILFIQCPECAKKYDQCCSQKCCDFIKLPEEERAMKRGIEEFNGSKFSKGRYKAHHQEDELDVQ